MLRNGVEKIHVCRISAFGLLTNLLHHKDLIAEAGEIEALFLTGTKTEISVMNMENRMINKNSNHGITNGVPKSLM